MEDNKKDLKPRNTASTTPAHLLASVLEQRYAHKSSGNLKSKDEKPDPMTFPAMQKALGSVYSTIVEIVEEEEANENIEEMEETVGETAADAIENVRGLSQQLLSMVDEIEQSDREREEDKKAVVIEVQKKKDDPYNRAVNSYSEPLDEIDTIDLSEEIAIETIISDSPRKRNKRFRSEA